MMPFSQGEFLSSKWSIARGNTMLFYVSIKVTIPPETDPQTLEALKKQEVAHAAELEARGKWLHVWRVVGKWANVSIFDVSDTSELHAILTGLPLYPFMDIEVTALCEMHPPPVKAVQA
jgi:muconolactone D-isomerase